SAYQQFDARQYLAANWETMLDTAEENPCISGLVLRGVKKPQDCPAFGTACTPDHPLGAPMVSSEGACAAYYRYRPN
ncbi:MAG: hydrogenase formation protein HypD, partial [Flavobacteriaceae bacterium]